MDAENPWKTTALASAFDTIDVTIGGAPSSGSCEFVPQESPSNPLVIALETPIRVRCLNWTDPMLRFMPQRDDGTTMTDDDMSYRISLQLHRTRSSLCSESIASSSSDHNEDEYEYDEVMVPRHRFTSTHEAEAVLPYTNTTALRNVMVLNTLLMLAIVMNLVFTLTEMVFGTLSSFKHWSLFGS